MTFWYVQTKNFNNYRQRPIVWKVNRTGGGEVMGIYRWQAEDLNDRGEERRELCHRVEPPTGRCFDTRLEALIDAKKRLESDRLAAQKDILAMETQLYWIGMQPVTDPPQYIPDPRMVEEAPGG